MLPEKENVNEVQIHWIKEYGMPPPTRVTVAQLHEKSGLVEQCKMWARYALKSSQFN
jgi:type III secretory pathway lipoprotein EscJ